MISASLRQVSFALYFFKVFAFHFIYKGNIMYKNKLIEITQDAACIIEKQEKDVIGFFTENIETCLIYIIITDTVTIAIHDSGQLCLKNIANFVKEYNIINSITLASGPHLNETNEKRLPELISLINYKGDVQTLKSQYPIFSISYEIGKSVEFHPNTMPSNVKGIPNKDFKQTIVELNNNFLPLNSQSLPLDIQFKKGKYCNNTKLIFSLDEMLQTYTEQVNYREINLAFLKKGQEQKLFTLPEELQVK